MHLYHYILHTTVVHFGLDIAAIRNRAIHTCGGGGGGGGTLKNHTDKNAHADNASEKKIHKKKRSEC